ncbi:uncharacterized protein VTP21DRAFT_2459 [Calcarisporiella thermophila]|uniref:uncharacterized protein n=1 Tax=Calcarisporiella thermophila TaxID=911321 RepID=UPI0037420108
MAHAKQNYSTQVEDTVNDQIHVEQTASHTYRFDAAWCDRDNVALPGLESYFRHKTEEESERAQKLISYQNMRGGRAILKQVPAPATELRSPKKVVEGSLQLEKDVNKALLSFSLQAQEAKDAQLDNYVKQKFLAEQAESIEELARMTTQLERVGADGLGLYIWDRDLKHKTKV